MGDVTAMQLASSRALIGEGGLLRQVEARCHLTGTKSQIVVALLLTWVPVMLLGAGTELATDQRVALVHDGATHVRLLVALPLLLFLDRVFPVSCTQVADTLARDDFVTGAEQARFEALLARIRWLCERWLPELVLGVLALGFGAAKLGAGLTAADWWYALVAYPLYEFLIFRSLWRWAIWVYFLLGLSRIDLDLDATHPDTCGGISFLRNPSLAYCALLLGALSAVVSATWSERFQLGTLLSFVPFLLLLAAVACALAFGPLLLFAPALQRARFAARDTLGGLAVRNGRWFRDRWIATPAGEAITSGDVQSLAALAATYRDTVARMRFVLFGKRDLLLVLVAALLPVLPTMLVRIPRDEWEAMTSFLMARFP